MVASGRCPARNRRITHAIHDANPPRRSRPRRRLPEGTLGRIRGVQRRPEQGRRRHGLGPTAAAECSGHDRRRGRARPTCSMAPMPIPRNSSPAISSSPSPKICNKRQSPGQALPLKASNSMENPFSGLSKPRQPRVSHADEAGRAAERVARESYGWPPRRLPCGRTRDVAGAEDALSEAFAEALRTWPGDGVPQNPDTWLLTVARRRQTDAIRRRQSEPRGRRARRWPKPRPRPRRGEMISNRRR